MILTWCLYAVVVALLVTAVAAAAERNLALLDQPVRWTWLAAMALSVGLPLGYLVAVSGGGPPPRPMVPADLPVVELRGLTVPSDAAGSSAGFLDGLAAAERGTEPGRRLGAGVVRGPRRLTRLPRAQRDLARGDPGAGPDGPGRPV